MMAHTWMFGSVFETEKWPPIFDALGNEGGIEGVDIWRCALPGHPALRVPMISICTIEDDEIDRRAEAGADPTEVMENHTTWIWFTTREAWAHAWRIARCLMRGGLIEAALPPRHLIEVLEGALWVDPAAPHVTEAA